MLQIPSLAYIQQCLSNCEPIKQDIIVIGSLSREMIDATLTLHRQRYLCALIACALLGKFLST
jgi:hypothetical protein